jgi:hypothetical protein
MFAYYYSYSKNVTISNKNINMVQFAILVIVVVGIAWYFGRHLNRRKPLVVEPLPANINGILEEHVLYYTKLKSSEQRRFSQRIAQFLSGVSIKGIGTEVNDIDRVLVAAGAIIPVFGFDEWEYYNLNEVLLYPDSFNTNFETAGNERNILGMVGWGYMNGTMTLSKPALHLGFSNKTDKFNVSIHEFVHLIDKLDGATDGVPDYIIDKAYALPWLQMMHKEMKRISEDESDINPYGLTNEAEFYSVASEYFFERPALFKRKHPELYKALSDIFKQNPAHI